MKKLSILLSTINDRIYNTTELLAHTFADTEFVVVHQITDAYFPDAYLPFYEKYRGRPVKFVQKLEKGTGKSRNAAMENADGELFYLCDDDLILKPDFYKEILQAAAENPDADILTFKIEGTDGRPYKNYPAQPYIHTIRSTATVSIVEMVIRKRAFDKGWIRFDELFGLATVYNTGEEFVMLTDALKKGAVAKYIPVYLVQHPQESSGKIYNAAVAFAKGAMIARVYGWKCIIIDGLFAIRKYREYKSSISFLKFTWNIYKGSLQFLFNE